MFTLIVLLQPLVTDGSKGGIQVRRCQENSKAQKYGGCGVDGSI